MKLNFAATQFRQNEAGGFTAFTRGCQAWWYRLPAGFRLPVWPLMLATLLILGLMLAFHQVASGAVQQGELRRKASAVLAEATWRCNSARASSIRDTCLQQLKSAARNDAMR